MQGQREPAHEGAILLSPAMAQCSRLLAGLLGLLRSTTTPGSRPPFGDLALVGSRKGQLEQGLAELTTLSGAG